jgi:hypothetical protein
MLQKAGKFVSGPISMADRVNGRGLHRARRSFAQHL